MNSADMAKFRRTVWEYFDAHKRDMPWRRPGAGGVFDPYHILVSEVMLQQTQVVRVAPKYSEFLQAFPAVHDLAAAELGDVLRLWSGLGYNRRAKYLRQAAQYAVQQWDGQLPGDVTALTRMPGVGRNTAGAICAYAFDMPVVFIETNIRTVYIHHFFQDQSGVSDTDLLPLIEASLQHLQHSGRGVREWYWALMDYGTHVKSVVGNTARASKQYTKQSTFNGSVRQLRGQILRLLAEKPLALSELEGLATDDRLHSVVQALAAEGLVRQYRGKYVL